VAPRKSVSILDVGHGNSAVLVDDLGVVVIDAGPGSSLLEFLVQESINRIDVLLISHADKDHIKGVIALLGSEEFTIGRVRLNSDALKQSALWDDLLYLLNQESRRGHIDAQVALVADASETFDQGSVRVEVVAPSLYLAGRSPGSTDRCGRRLTSNSVSAAIRLIKGDQPIIFFPGDIDDVGFDNLLESDRDITAPILVFPHHGGLPGAGSVATFARRLCAAVRPEMVIFSIGRGEYGMPQPDVVAAVREVTRNVRIACTQLSTHCAAALPIIPPKHLTGKFARGRQYNKCCAGTLVIDLDDSMANVLPASIPHQDFISSFAATALCMKPLRSQHQRVTSTTP